MKTNRKTKIICGLCSLAILAGCGTTQPVQKKAPASALDCRAEIYDNPNDRKAILASGGGLSLGASVAIALASGAMSHAVASGAEKRQLNDCYDRVGAAPSERLPLTASTKQHDEVLLAGGTVTEAQRAVTPPTRRGPGGGAGFGSF